MEVLFPVDPLGAKSLRSLIGATYRAPDGSGWLIDLYGTDGTLLAEALPLSPPSGARTLDGSWRLDGAHSLNGLRTQ